MAKFLETFKHTNLQTVIYFSCEKQTKAHMNRTNENTQKS